MSDRFDRAIAYLDGRINLETTELFKRHTPSLDQISRVADFMANPQEAQPVIHVTGTNGKGSTTAIITELLVAHDVSVGTYTSPDLGRVNQRIAHNGIPISDDELQEALEIIAELEAMAQVRLSRFEVLTLVAFRWFAEIAVDVAVLEVGMGGRWDATNVADATVAVLTNVSNDHLDILGPTITDVAMEKVGIVKPGTTLILGEGPDSLEVTNLIEREAISEGASAIWRTGREFYCRTNELAIGGRLLDLVTPSSTYEDVFLALHGKHQGTNAVLALGAVEAFFGRPIDDELVRLTFANLRVPGRFEIVDRQPLIVLDGAHNPAGAATAIATLGDFHAEGYVLVVGMNRGRDPREMLDAFEASRARLVVICEPDTPRAMPANEIAQVAQDLCAETIVVPRVADALKRARSLSQPEEAILAAGSLYLVTEARQSLGMF